MYCELCGSKSDNLIETSIEGAVLKVCKDCSKMGTILHQKKEKPNSLSMTPEYKKKYDIDSKKESYQRDLFKGLVSYVEGYGRIIQSARERMGFSHKEFSKRYGIKESLIHAIEAERIEPTEKMGKQLEKSLNINIIEDSNSGSDSVPFVSKENDNSLTIGDFLKVRNKK